MRATVEVGEMVELEMALGWFAPRGWICHSRACVIRRAARIPSLGEKSWVFTRASEMMDVGVWKDDFVGLSILRRIWVSNYPVTYSIVTVASMVHW